MRIYINDDWLFLKEYTDEMLNDFYDVSNMEAVRLPHSVVDMPFNYFDESIYQMISAYRKVIIPINDWVDKCIILTVEGAAHKSTIYINGKKVKPFMWIYFIYCRY